MKYIWYFVDSHGCPCQFWLENYYSKGVCMLPTFTTKSKAITWKKNYKTDGWHKTSWKLKKIELPSLNN